MTGRFVISHFKLLDLRVGQVVFTHIISVLIHFDFCICELGNGKCQNECSYTYSNSFCI